MNELRIGERICSFQCMYVRASEKNEVKKCEQMS